MSKYVKRILTLAVALAMLVGYLPGISLPARAEGWLDAFSVTDLGVEYTEFAPVDSSKTLNGSSGWGADGTTITNTTTQQKNAPAAYTVLTLTNNKDQEAHLVFSWEASKVRAASTITCTIYDAAGTAGDETELFATGNSGNMDILLASGAYVTFRIDACAPGRSNTETITFKLMDLNLYVDKVVNTTFQAVDAAQGSYTVDGEAITADTIKTQKAADTYEVVATPADGYVFSGWYSVTADKYLATSATATLKLDQDQTVYPMFIKAEDAVWSVGEAYFENLADATYCAERSEVKVVALLKDYTLTGTHTIPAEVVLLVPFDVDKTCYTDVPGVIPKLDIDNDGYLNDPAAWQTPYAFRTLTLAANAELIVKGGLSVSAQHHGVQGYSGAPSGPCGFLVTEEGAKITIDNGGSLYAWGYVVGDGTVEALSGSTVYENLQIVDFRGGSASSHFVNTDTTLPEEELEKYVVFPFTQYYVQNVEIPLTIKSGAKEVVQVTIYAASAYQSIPVDFIGTDKAMFRMEEGASITKAYDDETDRLVISVDGNVSLNGMTVVVPGFTGEDGMDSSMFNLPINSNITINVNSGSTTINQNVALLPGVQVNVAQNAKLVVGEGWDLYVYDRDEWIAKYFVHANAYLRPIRWTYANGLTAVRDSDDLLDAKINVNGMLEVWGYLYVTEGGANICTSEGTGVVVLWAGNGDKEHTYQTTQVDTSVTFEKIPMSVVQLVNADGTYTSTENAEASGAAYIYDSTSGTWLDTIVVQFSGNGATGSVDDKELPALDVAVPEDEVGNVYNVIELPENGFTRTGYTFVEWNTKADGTGTGYQPGDDFYVTDNVTLYAIWACQHTNTHTENAEGATCTKEGYTGDTVCDACGETLETGTVIEMEAHSFTQNLCGTLKTPGDCKNEAVYAVKCDNCAFESDTLTVKGEKDASNHVGEVEYTNNGENHSAAYDCCGTPYVTNETHKYDQEGDKCICGAEKPHVCAENLTAHEAITPDCQTVGNTAYWSCTCGKFYSDAEATTQIEENSWNLGKGDHVFTQNLRGTLKTPGDCKAEAVYAVKCDKCDAESETLTVKGEKDASKHTGKAVYTNNGENHSAVYDCCGAPYVANETHKYDREGDKCICGAEKPHVCAENLTAHEAITPDCQTVGNTAYWSCTCGKFYSDAEATSPIEENSWNLGKDASKHTGKAVYTNNGENHSAAYDCCGTPYVANETHKYDQEGDKCICGAEKPHVCAENLTAHEAITPDCQTVGNTAYWSCTCGKFYSDAEANTPIEENSWNLGKGDHVFTQNLRGTLKTPGDCKTEAVYAVKCDKCDAESETLTVKGEKDASNHTGEVEYTNNGENHSAAYNCCSTEYVTNEDHNYDDATFKCVCKAVYDGIYTAANGDMFYVVEGVAIANKGLVRVYENGEVKYYYFGCSATENDSHEDNSCDPYKAQRNGVHWVENTNDLLPAWDYTFGADGVIVCDDALNNNEEQTHKIVTYGDAKFYTIDGIKVPMGLLRIEGDYYYVRSSGELVCGKTYWVTNTNGLMPEGNYTFDEECKMVMNGVVDGYYYVDGVRTYAGLIEIEGNYYYVRTNGQLATGNYWITKTNGLMPEASYNFDENGVMTNPNLLPEVDENTTGVVDGYYFENGVLTYAGLIKIEGDYYYVRSNGKVATGSYWISKTNGLLLEARYTFGEDGKMLNAPELPEVGEGFTGIVDGYYYENGELSYAGLIEIDGEYYYIRSNGQVVTGRYWVTKTNDLMPQGMYTFGADGAMIVR